MIDGGEKGSSEFKTYTLESFGQILKVSSSVPTEALPYRVEISKKSGFFNSLYESVYKGRGAIVKNSLRGGVNFQPRGIFIEHTAAVAANNFGELMVSREVFIGSMANSLTNISQQEYNKWLSQLESVGLPLGWRTFGTAHSHPFFDTFNNLAFLITRAPRVAGIPLTWSGGDFRGFINSAKYGAKDFSTSVLITQTQLSLMVATETTLKELQRSDDQFRKALAVEWWQLPPYHLFRRLGIALYGGNHFGSRENKFPLERLY